MIRISSYALKSGFQRLLTPVMERLITMRVTPNGITLFTCVLCLLYALAMTMPVMTHILLLMMPLLVVYADLCGIGGGMLIGTTFLDQPPSVYIEHTLDRIELKDLAKGFIKGQCYAVVIATVGCLRGLQTRQGAQGVGRSATSAVVSAIFLIIVVDAVLTIIFYILDWQ